MLKKIAGFFIHNSKLTSVLVIVTLLAGVMSYIFLPKQYNPTIVMPAFQVMVGTPGLSGDEGQRLVLNELENKIMELEGVDDLYGLSSDHMVSVMVKFRVGEDAEKAKIRLLQKLSQNMGLKPLGVSDPKVVAINPDDLPQITYAIAYTPKSQTGALSEQDAQIYLRQIANLVKDHLKTIDHVTTLDLVGGIKKNLVIDLDLDALKSKNLDVGRVAEVLQKNILSLPSGSFHLEDGQRVFLETKGTVNSVEELSQIVLSLHDGQGIFLGDVAKIRYGQKRLESYTQFATASGSAPAVLLGVGKQVGSNGVFFTQEVKEALSQFQAKLPKDLTFSVIQDEGAEAQMATGHLIVDLLESILIVVLILVAFLGRKNALNTATSIPLILSLVFLYAFVVGYDINRISLFALILVIGMLVDDSIVVVENIHRHLEERHESGKTKLQAILEASSEVGPGVILSTITKVLSFVGMFAVTGMMGEYMGPIPKFAIVALLFSILIAFSINPWISYLTTKDEVKKHTPKTSRWDVRKLYVKVMEYYIVDTPKAKKRRSRFKLTFWVALILVMALPIYFGIFKARMLPKSNKDQVYVWIDAPRGTSVESLVKVNEAIESFFLHNKDLPKSLQIAQSVTSSVGTPFMGDFANLFRGGNTRREEYMISSRVNLIPAHEHEDRLKSEVYVYTIRPLFEDSLLKKFPDLKIRLLEDPPGPPVRATFMIELRGGDAKGLQAFTKKVASTVQSQKVSQQLVDLYTTLPTTYRKIEIELDHEAIARVGLSVAEVSAVLGLVKNSTEVGLYKPRESLEPTSIVLGVENRLSESTELLSQIEFTNAEGIKIPLSSISKIKYDFVSPEINTDHRHKAEYIYAEMGNNSVVYPIVKLMGIFGSPEFLGQDYEYLDWSFYGMKFRNLHDGQVYELLWDGEWKLTMDTFRDLGTAMILSLLVIYFLMVGQMKSFGVAGIVMMPFLLGFFGIFPGFSILYLLKNEYFNATGMIGVISLAGIVVGNAILLIDYIQILKARGRTIERAIITAGYIRFMPIMLTSISAIFGAIKITADPVWSGLARSIVWGLSASAILTLIVIPIFYYNSQKGVWEKGG